MVHTCSPEHRSAEDTALVGDWLKPHQGNLLLGFLMEHLRLGGFGVAVVTFAVLWVINVLINAFQGTLLPAQSFPNALFSREWATHLTSVPFLFPVLAATIFAMYRRIPMMFDDLINSGVIETNGETVTFFRKLQGRYKSTLINALLAVFMVFLAIGWAVVKSRQAFSDWTHVVPGQLTVSAWYWIVVGSASVYVLLHAAYTMLVTCAAIHHFFSKNSRFRVTLKLMHPDRCCGLRPISQFVLGMAMMLAIAGLMVGIYIVVSLRRLDTMQALVSQIGPLLCVIGYVVLAPTVFFAPLWPVHRLMKDRKHDFQMRISQEFDSCFRDVHDQIARGHVDRSEQAHLKSLNELQRYVDAFPVWPFDLGMLSRFATMVVMPVLIPIVVMTLERLL